MQDNSLLITGASGNNGMEILKLLAARGIAARAMIRPRTDASALSALPGITVVEGDFDVPASLEGVLNGVQRAFLLTNSTERAEAQQLAFVEAARRGGVQHLVKLSQWAADAHSPVRFLRYHAAVEQSIRASGMEYTVLRPNLFMQGLLGFRETIAGQDKFFAAIGEAKISLVDVRDIAAVAVAALTEGGHAGKTYNLTGPEALSHPEMAAKLSQALNRPIQFVPVAPARMREELIQHQFPEWQADGLIEDYAHYGRGEAAALAPGVVDATGKSPRSFDGFARDYAAAFS